MSEHNPGSWQLGPKLNGFVFTVVNPTRDAETGDWLVAKVRWEQDARLIAAAPETAAERDRLRKVNAELLAAIKGLLKAVKNASVYENGALDVIHAADIIAKAEGKS
jgi:mono/diheme cytochrome c family protein